MIKTMHFLTRKPGMTHEECIRYHRDIHAPLAARVLGKEQKLLKKYVGCYLEEAADMPYDLLVEQWYEDKDWERMKKFRETDAYAELRRDTNEMVDREKAFSWVFEENVII
jgi:hypothetical protein